MSSSAVFEPMSTAATRTGVLASADTELHAPVACIVRAGRSLRAVGDGRHPALGDVESQQVVAHGTGTALAEREVVLQRPALVAVAFEDDANVGLGAQLLGMGFEGPTGVRRERGEVELEVDGRPLVVGTGEGVGATAVARAGVVFDLVRRDVVFEVAVLSVLLGDLLGAFRLQAGGVGKLPCPVIVAVLIGLIGLVEEVPRGAELRLGAAFGEAAALERGARGIERVGRRGATTCDKAGDQRREHSELAHDLCAIVNEPAKESTMSWLHYRSQRGVSNPPPFGVMLCWKYPVESITYKDPLDPPRVDDTTT